MHKGLLNIGEANLILLTLDSCRWDSFEAAETPIIDSFGEVVLAYSQATFTYPSHLALFQGILPISPQSLAYYNRFVSQLVRINRRPTSQPSLLCLPPESPNIISGLREAGYYTHGCGAVEWFRHSDLVAPFEEFHFTGIHAIKQVELAETALANTEFPAVIFVNFGETHYPYEYSASGVEARHKRAVAWTDRQPSEEFDETSWHKQIKCVEFLDSHLQPLLSLIRSLSRPSIVVICGDHGECFGEGGLFGHGFYHPKVMEVPLGIFLVGIPG